MINQRVLEKHVRWPTFAKGLLLCGFSKRQLVSTIPLFTFQNWKRFQKISIHTHFVGVNKNSGKVLVCWYACLEGRWALTKITSFNWCDGAVLCRVPVKYALGTSLLKFALALGFYGSVSILVYIQCSMSKFSAI